MDIANLQRVRGEVIPRPAQIIDETALDQRGKRAGQPGQHVFGNLLVSTKSGTRQAGPADTRYGGQGRVTDRCRWTVGARLDAAAECGFCAGPAIFAAKPEGMGSSRPTHRI